MYVVVQCRSLLHPFVCVQVLNLTQNESYETMLNSLATRVDTATQASLPVHEMKALMEKLSRRAFLEGKDGSDGDQDWVTWWQSSVLSLSTMVNCPYKDIMRFVRQSVGLKQKMLDVHRDFIV